MVQKQIDGDNKLLIILLWIFWPVGLIWWLVDEEKNKNPFIKYHVKQWLVALIASIIWAIAYGFFYGIVSLITFGFFAFIGWIGFFLPLIWVVQDIIYTLNGEEKELWLIGKYAKKLTF